MNTTEKMIPVSRIKKLWEDIDKKHPKDITDDYQDGYDMAVAEIYEMVRDVLKGE